MDWPRARAILMAAFTAVNVVLALVVWGPQWLFPAAGEAPFHEQVELVREIIAARGLVLPASVNVPRNPGPMPFLHVQYRPTLAISSAVNEHYNPRDFPVSSQSAPGVDLQKVTFDPELQALIYEPNAKGPAALPVHLENQREVQQVAEEYLRRQNLLPPGARFSRVLPHQDPQLAVVEFVPVYDGYPVFSGYLKVEVSARGVERVADFWVEPRGYTPAPPKEVRPATEALLRLAGRLEAERRQRTVVDIQLGYYANRALTVLDSEGVQGWDTVPVWQIMLDTGEIYYINAFNGEWES